MTDVDDLLWSHVSDRLFCTKEQYLASLDSFTITGVRRDGKLVGAVMVRGPEIHVAWTKGISATKGLLREHLGAVIAKYGCAITRVPRSRQVSQDFVTRLGFKQTHEDALDVFYKIERMRYV